jgi:eukaryotic-like serine/threonine-protein kinase
MNCPHCNTINADSAESCGHCGTPMPGMDAVTIEIVDTAALAPGSDFGSRYRIEKILGQGGMGRVYKAYDKNLDRIVALKVVREGMMSESDALKRFKQEMVLASKISHRNILRIHDMGEVGDMKFITMAFVEGTDLHGILKANPELPLERTLSFALQLAEALEAAHEEGVVHRDLKPQNILVASDDHIYVADFGLAKSFEENAIRMTRTGAFLGTPRYMSPEQVEGKPADQRSDLYAYGLILYEMATGDVPFTGESTLKVMYQRIQEMPKDPQTINPGLPDWFTHVIMRCLERDPDVRYQTASEILVDLRASHPEMPVRPGTRRVAPKAGASASSASVASRTTTRSGVSIGGASLGGGTRTVQIEIPQFAEKKWVWAIVGVAALLLVGLVIPPVRHLVFKSGATKTTNPPTPTISGIPPLSQGKFVAILPFRVIGDDQALSYVAEGLNQALSSKLFQLKDLRVSSGSAVAGVSSTDPIDKTARALGANLIVTGVVQGSEKDMRIIVNLDDAADGKRTWSQEFSGVPKDLLSIQDQISAQLVTALALKLSNEELASTAERPTDNVEAYDLYLRGNQALKSSNNVKAVQQAYDYFEQSIKQDPSFALAYTGLTDASLTMYRLKKDTSWAEKALAAAQRAEQLKESLPEVHFSLGSVYMKTGKTVQAITELKRGIDLAPNSDEGYIRLGGAYLDNGQLPEAIRAYRSAIAVNPYYWGSHMELGDAYLNAGDNERALAEFQRVTELEPENASGWDNVGAAYYRMGKYEQCITAFQKSLQLNPTWNGYSNLSGVYFMLKRYNEAIDAAKEAVALGPNQQMAAGNLADAYRAAGQKDQANATYDQAIALAFKDLTVNPESTDAMSSLALYYARKGQPDRGMEYIARARAVDRDNVELIYIQAVVENLSNRTADALRDLELALTKGYPAKEADADPEFANLKGHLEFDSMINKYSKSPAH